MAFLLVSSSSFPDCTLVPWPVFLGQEGGSSTQMHSDLCEWRSLGLPGLWWRVYQLRTS